MSVNENLELGYASPSLTHLGKQGFCCTIMILLPVICLIFAAYFWAKSRVLSEVYRLGCGPCLVGITNSQGQFLLAIEYERSKAQWQGAAEYRKPVEKAQREIDLTDNMAWRCLIGGVTFGIRSYPPPTPGVPYFRIATYHGVLAVALTTWLVFAIYWGKGKRTEHTMKIKRGRN